MDVIYTICESGHRLKGKPTLAGKTVQCPTCGKPAVFPAFEKQPLSDTGVMQILGDPEQTPDPPRPSKIVTYRGCPRCHQKIPASLRICSHCKCYLGVAPRIWDRLFHSSDRAGPSLTQPL